MTAMRFRDLANGQEFDFIDDSRPGYNSFITRVKKVGRFHYAPVGTDLATGQYSMHDIYRVGSINARVFHVGEVVA